MDKEKLEEKLRKIHIPEPDEARKNATLKAALEGYEKENKKNIKGSVTSPRLKDKKDKWGGIIMSRPILATASIAAITLVMALNIMPGIISHKNPAVKIALNEQISRIEERNEPVSTSPANKADSDKKRALVEAEEEIAPVFARVQPKSKMKVEGAVVGKENLSKPAPAKKLVDKRIIAKRENVAKRKKQLSMGGAASPADDMSSTTFATGKAISLAQPTVSKDGFIMNDSEVASIPSEYSGRDKFDHKEVNPVKVVKDEPVSTFSIDVDTASYAFMRRALNNGHLPQKDAVRVEEMVNYFNYNYDIPKDRARPFKPTVALYATPWNADTQLLHIGIKGHDILEEERQPANLVFLLDVSGSMSSPDKLPLLKNSMKMLVEELHDDDTVSIAVYAGAAGTVLEPTKVSEKGKIIAALDKLNAGGSTAGGAGIKLAYSLAEANFKKDALNRVILATDGDFNVGIQNQEELKGFVERKRKSGIYLSVIGFGQGNYNDALMQKLAQNGNGNAAYIDTLSEARKVLVEEANSTLYTIAKDVKIQVEFNPAQVAEYRLIGYENRMLKREDFNNDQVDAGEVGAGHTVTAIYEITPTNSKSKLVDNLRYGKKSEIKQNNKESEIAFLKIRYKLPDESKSRLTTKAIDNESFIANRSELSNDIRFAASVAAFGQLLRGTPFTKDFGYEDVINLAESARGRDRFGYRSEFLNLVRLAKAASTMGDR